MDHKGKLITKLVNSIWKLTAELKLVEDRTWKLEQINEVCTLIIDIKQNWSNEDCILYSKHEMTLGEFMRKVAPNMYDRLKEDK